MRNYLLEAIIDKDCKNAYFLEFTTRFGDPELSSELLLLNNVSKLLFDMAGNNSPKVKFNNCLWSIGIVAKGGNQKTLRDRLGFTHDFIETNYGIESCYSVAGRDFKKVINRAYKKLNNSISDDSIYRKDIGYDVFSRLKAFEKLSKNLGGQGNVFGVCPHV